MSSLAACWIAVGCATSSTTPGPERSLSYRKDLSITLTRPRVQVEGFGVLPRLRAYPLAMRSRKEPELIRLSNCHRDSVFRDVDDKFSYEYVPNRLIESGSCILQITFLDSKGYHQFGAISFRDDETLPADLSCNGSRIAYEGASVCQGKAGTLQVIQFEEPVQVKASKGCDKPSSDDDKAWEYPIKEGFCVYLFRSHSEEFHKLTTFGYTDFVKS